jgi:hypothetical protein
MLHVWKKFVFPVFSRFFPRDVPPCKTILSALPTNHELAVLRSRASGGFAFPRRAWERVKAGGQISVDRLQICPTVAT